MSLSRLAKISFVFLFLSIEGFYVNGQTPSVPNGRRLRDIVEDKYQDRTLLIGGTTGEWAFGKPTGIIMDREYNYVTPENDFKQNVVHPDNGTNSWHWTRPDAWINHVVAKNQILRMHAPISPQCSNWAKSDNRTAEELETNMRAYTKAICQRYNGKANFYYLDVVNEIVQNGQWKKNEEGTGWELPWFIIGQDTDINRTPLYIKYAFEIANEYAPDLKLVINEHENPANTGTWNLIKETVQYLRNMDLRVDGIGWQGHVDVGWEKIEGNQQALRNLIDWAHNNNLDFHITENNVFLENNSKASFEAQAETFKAIMDIVVEKSVNGLVTWNTWNIDDANAWQSERYPTLFDNDYEAKPAYYALQLALEAKGDYKTQHDVIFQVKNTESGNAIDNCEVTFNNETKNTNDKGEVSFKATADFYNVSAEKRHYESVSERSMTIYSDTVLTLMLDSAEVLYNVTFQVTDKTSGVKLSAVNVDAVVQQLSTDLEGKTVFILRPGIYSVGFSKTNYANFTEEFSVNSDTTLQVELVRSHADLKIRLRDGTQPVNDARVILGNDTLYSTALGLCTFKSVPLDSVLNYTVERQYFKPVGGTLSITTDTTLSLQLEKTIANIEFHVSTELVPIKDAYVILNNDTAWFDESNVARLYKIPVDAEYPFSILSNNYSKYSNSLQLSGDTTVYIEMVYTSVSNLKDENYFMVYPNPASYKLNIKSDIQTEKILIIDSSGRIIRQKNCSSKSFEIDVSDLLPGYYFVKVFSTKTGIVQVRPFSIRR